MTCTEGLPAGLSSRSLQLLAAAVAPSPPPAMNRQSLCYCVVLRAVAALSLPAASTAATGDKYLFHARDAAVQRFPLAAARHTAATGAAARTEAAKAEAAAAKSGTAKAAAAAKLGAAEAEAAAATEAREVAAVVRSASVSSPAPVAHCCSRLAARQFHSRAARPAAAAAIMGARRGQTHLLSSSCGAAASPCLSAAPDSAASLSAAAALAAPRVCSAASSISPRGAAAPALPQLRAAAAPAKPLRAAAAARAGAAAAGATSTASVVAGTPAAAASPAQLMSLPEFLLRRKRRFPPAQQQQAAFDLAVIFESLSALSYSANVAATSLASRAAAVASIPRVAVLVPRESGGAAAPTPSLPAVSPAGAAAAACTADPLVGFSQRQQSKAAPPPTAAAAVGGLHACGKRVRGEEEAAATARRLWSAAVETAKANSDLLQVPQLLGIVHAAARANIKVPSFATKMRQRALQLVKQICSPHAFLRLLLDLEKMDGLNDRQLLLFRDAIAARLLPARAGKGKTTETPLQGEKQQLHAGEEEDTLLHKGRPQKRQTHAAERRELRKGSGRGGEDEEGAEGGGGRMRVKAEEAGVPAGEREEKLRVERVRKAPMDARERTAVEKGEHEGRTNAEKCGEEASGVWDTGKNGGRAGVLTVESNKPVRAGDREMLFPEKREGRELLLLQTPEEKSEPVLPPGAEEEASQSAGESRVAALLHAEERRWGGSVVRPAPPFVVVMLLHLLAKHRIRDVDILLQASSSLLHEEVALLAALRQTPALLPTLVLSLAKLEAGGCCKLLLQELLDRHAFPLLSELRVQELLNLAYALVCLHTHSRVTILRSGSTNRQQQQERCSRQQDRCSRQHEWQEQEGQFDQQQQRQDPPCPQQQLREGEPCIQQQPEKQLWVQQQTQPDEQHEQQVQCGEQVQQPPQEACTQQQQRCHCSRSRSRGRRAGSTAREKTATSSEVLEPLLVDKQRLKQQEQVLRNAAFKVQHMSDVHVRRNLVDAEGTAKLSRIATAFDCGSLPSTSNKPTSETVNRCSVPVVEKKWGALSSSALPAAANGGGVVAGAAVASAGDSAAAAASIGGACLRSTTSGSACASDFYTRATAARADSFGSAGHDIATPSAGSTTANAVGGSGGAADFSTAAAAASAPAPADTATEGSLSVGQSGAIARAAAAACPAPLSNQENGFACSPEQLQQRSLLLTTTLRLLLHRLRRDREARPTAASSIAWRQLKFVDAYLAHDVGPLRLAEHQQQQQEEREPQQTPPQELHKLQARLQGKHLERSGRGRTVHGEIISLLLHARQRAVSNVVRISELQKRVGSVLLQQQIDGLVVEQPVGPFVLDFAIPSKRVAVEIDGEAHFYLHTSVPTARTRFKRELLTAMGWHVVVVPEELWKQKKKTKVKNFVTKKVREALATK